MRRSYIKWGRGRGITLQNPKGRGMAKLVEGDFSNHRKPRDECIPFIGKGAGKRKTAKDGGRSTSLLKGGKDRPLYQTIQEKGGQPLRGGDISHD